MGNPAPRRSVFFDITKGDNMHNLRRVGAYQVFAVYYRNGEQHRHWRCTHTTRKAALDWTLQTGNTGTEYMLISIKSDPEIIRFCMKR